MNNNLVYKSHTGRLSPNETILTIELEDDGRKFRYNYITWNCNQKQFNEIIQTNKDVIMIFIIKTSEMLENNEKLELMGVKFNLHSIVAY